ncbi:MAG TPA: DinB family protein [Thermoanaerobaculia bacterium]
MKEPDVRQMHSTASAEFATAAANVRAQDWLVPRSDEKWSPAQIVEHVTLAYDVLLRELAGGAGMQVRTKLWQRMWLRMTVMRKLLRDGVFPEGAPAPREVRPGTPPIDQAAAIERFRERAARFESASEEAMSSGRRIRLTHAYFGPMAIDDVLLLCASHVRHHRKQLSAAGTAGSSLGDE